MRRVTFVTSALIVLSTANPAGAGVHILRKHPVAKFSTANSAAVESFRRCPHTWGGGHSRLWCTHLTSADERGFELFDFLMEELPTEAAMTVLL
jgi:hypothetical protein